MRGSLCDRKIEKSEEKAQKIFEVAEFEDEMTFGIRFGLLSA